MAAKKPKGEELVEASYYDTLKSKNVLEWLRPLIDQGGYRLRFGDGKLEAVTSIGHDGPWHHTIQGDDRDCVMRMSILWKVVFRKLERLHWVPSKCQECWKVVCRPPTLLGLFELEKVQEQMGYSAKCGIEKRPWVHGNYGGYWYTSSLEEGRRRYKEVRAAIDKNKVLGPDVPVLLKRGCTEFELRGGASDKWEVYPGQLYVEELVERKIESGVNFSTQPEHVVTKVHKDWIEHAYAVGDPTYALFTNGKPLTPPYVTYHEEEKPKKSTSRGKKGAKAKGAKKNGKG